MMIIPVTGLCDIHKDRLVYGSLRVLAPMFRSFGKHAAFAGPASTLKVFEDSGLVRTALKEQGAGCVLVVNGDGSLRYALVGGNLGRLAEGDGWGGILLNGCVHNTHELTECNVGIHALAVHPRKSIKRDVGQREVGVQMPGAYIQSGEWIYADEDGALISQDMFE